MDHKQFQQLREGNIIQNMGIGEVYNIIHMNFNVERGNTYIAVRTIEVTNPSEWKKIK